MTHLLKKAFEEASLMAEAEQVRRAVQDGGFSNANGQ